MIGNFSKNGFGVPLQNKTAPTITIEFINLIVNQVPLKLMMEKNLYLNLFTDFSYNVDFTTFSRYTNKQAVSAKKVIRTKRDLLK